MGSILSAIRDDEDTYEFLCRKYNSKPVEVYSKHHDDIEEYNNIREGTITFETFHKQKQQERDALKLKTDELLNNLKKIVGEENFKLIQNSK